MTVAGDIQCQIQTALLKLVIFLLADGDQRRYGSAFGNQQGFGSLVCFYNDIVLYIESGAPDEIEHPHCGFVVVHGEPPSAFLILRKNPKNLRTPIRWCSIGSILQNFSKNSKGNPFQR